MTLPRRLDLATAGAIVSQVAKIRCMKALIPDKAHTPDHAGHDADLLGSGFQTEAEGFADYERAMLQRA